MLERAVTFALIVFGSLLGTGCVLAALAMIAYAKYLRQMKAQPHLLWPS